MFLISGGSFSTKKDGTIALMMICASVLFQVVLNHCEDAGVITRFKTFEGERGSLVTGRREARWSAKGDRCGCLDTAFQEGVDLHLGVRL